MKLKVISKFRAATSGIRKAFGLSNSCLISNHFQPIYIPAKKNTMYLLTTIVLQCFAINALADVIFHDSDSSFVVHPLTNASRVTGDLYSHCEYKHEDAVIEGQQCVGEAVKVMVAFLSNAGYTHHGGDEAALLLNSIGVGDEVLPTTVKSTALRASVESGAAKSRREIENADSMLESFNDQIVRRSDVRGDIRAIGLERLVSPSEGELVVRTNVRSGDSTLFVRANSSHAVAAFKQDPSPSIGKRIIYSNKGVTFQGMQGFKLMVRWADGSFGFDKLEAALVRFVSGSAISEPQSIPMYRASDAWAFAVCGRVNEHTNDQMKLQGKLVSLDGNAGDNFENDGLINCDSFKEA